MYLPLPYDGRIDFRVCAPLWVDCFVIIQPDKSHNFNQANSLHNQGFIILQTHTDDSVKPVKLKLDKI